ncbi:aldehyde dehydrogenase [Rhodococcus opacus]|uniref:aldehyde dehydrogenase n=1 Tax=Rhodococcus opacus TaxID=37919 RepID=UPI002952BA0C|nr:aldehyde dehydrogenase [Rhodococcus opacus]MDV7089124.1 aldehyde dehydrogenase [Rhodococcus opacus]
MGLERSSVFIGGEFVRPHGTDRVDVVESSTEDPLGSYVGGNQRDIDAAVKAARHALPSWSRTDAADRADALDRFAQALLVRANETARLVSQENGMPIMLSNRANGATPARLLSYYAGLIRAGAAEEVRPSLLGDTIVRREPVGVIAAISPWNYPQSLAVMKIAPALAAGNTVILKASPEAALDAYVLADAAIEAGLPAGILNIVPGGRASGEHLVAHPGVDKVSFTGSTAAGRSIGEVCGRLIRPVSLELGGKSAAIVLDDVDLDIFAQNIMRASLANNGQTCYASTRILAPSSRYREVVDAVTDVAAGLTVGDPLDEATEIGPLVTAEHRARVLGYIAVGRASQARLMTGGGVPREHSRGFYVEPTVFADVRSTDVIAREEIFGPVLSIIEYDSAEEAVRLANDSDYGLGGTVWSSDEERAVDIARRVKTGSVGINDYVLDLGSPFGGVKSSGIGRELGPEALEGYTVLKSIYRYSAASASPTLLPAD